MLQRKVAGTFGHASDYSWLQGKVRRWSHEYWELRFCEYETGDERTDARWGGRVLLEDSARFERLQDGNVIRVEGRVRIPTLTPGIPGFALPAIYEVHRLLKIR